MQKIKILTNYKSYRAGDIIDISNSEAHTLIEQGVAVLYSVYNVGMMRGDTDKMMRAETRADRKARQRAERVGKVRKAKSPYQTK